jgi:hypothetical protein
MPSKENMEELRREIEMLKEDVEVLTLFAGDDVIMKLVDTLNRRWV